jgi:predicted Fe-Mo cluster-binding NifX family protein
MKLCVTAVAAGLKAPIDPRFGRCAFFVVVDTDTMAAESVSNPSADAVSGAGIQAAQMVARLGVSVLVTGKIGPNAIQSLSAAGIEIYQHQGKTVKDVVEAFNKGELAEITSPSAPPHAGMGVGAGFGRGPRRGERG